MKSTDAAITIHETTIDAGESQLTDTSELETNAVMGAPVGTVEGLDDRRWNDGATEEIA